MKNETITILPAKALDLFLNTELPAADILDATMPLDGAPTGDPLTPGTYQETQNGTGDCNLGDLLC